MPPGRARCTRSGREHPVSGFRTDRTDEPRCNSCRVDADLAPSCGEPRALAGGGAKFGPTTPPPGVALRARSDCRVDPGTPVELAGQSRALAVLDPALRTADVRARRKPAAPRRASPLQEQLGRTFAGPFARQPSSPATPPGHRSVALHRLRCLRASLPRGRGARPRSRPGDGRSRRPLRRSRPLRRGLSHRGDLADSR